MKRRTLKRYEDLYRDPTSLFPGVTVTIFPNGEPEIWVSDGRGNGMKIVASKGPAGLGVRLSTFVGSAPMTVTGNSVPDCAPIPDVDARHLEVCQYLSSPWAQAFKAWYNKRGDDPGPCPLNDAGRKAIGV